MSDDSERWLPVVGYEGYYEVSSAGRFRNVKAGRMRDGSPDPKWGYLRVGLAYKGRTKCVGIHQLVLAAFVGPRPEGLVSRHLNGDPTDNRLENLVYGTQSENMYDRVRHGTDPQANQTHCVNGHEFTVENVYIRPKVGGRDCRACIRDRVARYAARRKAA